MSRSIELYLDNILTSIDKIQRYTANMSQERFVADERTFDAVARNLQIIGEAVKSIPVDLRGRCPVRENRTTTHQTRMTSWDQMPRTQQL